MAAEVVQDKCSGCGDCVDACPVEGVITLQAEKARVNPDDCIECNACVDACSHAAMHMAG